MRSLVAALAALFALSLPALALAGEDCPYSKQQSTTASLVAPAADGHHPEQCSASCPHAAAGHAPAKTCPCSEGADELRPDDAHVAHSAAKATPAPAAD